MYLIGLIIIAIFLTLFYYKKLKTNHSHTMQPLMTLLVYTYGAIVVSLPLWMLVLVFVIIIFTLNAKPLETKLTHLIEPNEIFTLAKFLLLMGVILPLMPHQQISDAIPTSPYKIWLTVVIISAISYLGYLLKRYIFTKQGYFLMGIIGGVYSSTATTIVLAKKARSLKSYDHNLNAGIVSATGMLYIRLFVLTTIFNPGIIRHIGLPLSFMAVLTFASAFWVKRRAKKTTIPPTIETGKSNPLEMQVALIFATLFVVMTVITQYVVSHYGHVGLNFLSFVVGFTDIDPFVLSVLTGHFKDITSNQVASAILIAAASDNLLKATYAYFFSGRKNTKPAIIALLLLALITLMLGIII
ncbi:MAG TPA: DUF4010 domain-containing protein [Oceanospirillales bacterium]|nr:DUF4010 domain-containing protein [Oceanospirillales bacterium]